MTLLSRSILILCFFFASVFLAPVSFADKAADKAAAKQKRLENTLLLDLKYGRVEIFMNSEIAPKHVKRFRKLTREGFYDGLKFHRVIEGFMAQTGDPTGTGSGSSKYPDLSQEFSSHVSFERGTVAAARSSDIDSANSQFFICFQIAPWLNGKYTIWGRVVKGMKFVDLIKKGASGSGHVSNPDVIVRMQVASDEAKEREKAEAEAAK